MKSLIIALSLSALATTAFAESNTATCAATATEKNLSGAAKKSFMTKCRKEAKATCEAAANEKKLAGAAKNSNVKKCVKGAVGTA